MHEFSIAEALVEQVRRHTPAGSIATRVSVEAGPLQAIDPEALQLAWLALTGGDDLPDLAGVELRFGALPWTLSCPRCGKCWTGDEPYAACPACGG